MLGQVKRKVAGWLFNGQVKSIREQLESLARRMDEADKNGEVQYQHSKTVFKILLDAQTRLRTDVDRLACGPGPRRIALDDEDDTEFEPGPLGYFG